MVKPMSENEKVLNGRGRLLQGMGEVMSEYGLTRRQFKKFIRLGMPAAVIDGHWYAYTANIDRFFEGITLARVPLNLVDKEEEPDE
jgi:hypothetical protein